MALSPLTMLYNHQHHPPPKLFHPPKWKLSPHKQWFLLLPSPIFRNWSDIRTINWNEKDQSEEYCNSDWSYCVFSYFSGNIMLVSSFDVKFMVNKILRKVSFLIWYGWKVFKSLKKIRNSYSWIFSEKCFTFNWTRLV